MSRTTDEAFVPELETTSNDEITRTSRGAVTITVIGY